MARRFGGQHSPGQSQTPAPPPRTGGTVNSARPHPVGARVNMLFMMPFIFAIGAFFRDPAGLALHLLIFALLMGAAWLTREGVLAQAAFDARKVARRPAIPRKIFAAAVTGLGLGLAAASGGVVTGVLIAGLAAGLHLLAFGVDPLRDKGLEGVDRLQTDRATQAIQAAESLLQEMESTGRRLQDRALIKRIGDFATRVRPLFRMIEDDPRQLAAARRYLGVYLQGARDATVKYVELAARSPDPQARASFTALLDDLESRFALRHDSLLNHSRTDLDIEIEVLRERLAREGLTREGMRPPSEPT